MIKPFNRKLPMSSKAIFFFAILFLGACASENTSWKSVKATKGEPPYPCDKINYVQVNIMDGKERDPELVLELLKEEAGGVGATHVQVLELKAKGKLQAEGIAYKCPKTSEFTKEQLKQKCADGKVNSCLEGAYFLALTNQNGDVEHMGFYDSACKLGDQRSCQFLIKNNKAIEQAKEKKIADEKAAALSLKIKNMIEKNQPKCEAGDEKLCWDTYLELTINKFQSARYFLEKGCEYGHEKSCIVLQTKRNDENAKEQISLSKKQLSTQIQANEENSRRQLANDLKEMSKNISNSFVPKTQTCRTTMELGQMITRCD